MRGSQPTSPLRYYRRHHKPQAHSATDATSPHCNRYHDTTSPLRYRRSKPTPLPTLQAHSATDTTSLLRCRRHKPTPLLPTSHFPADATAHATATADAAAHSAIDTAPWLLVASFAAIAICTDFPARTPHSSHQLRTAICTTPSVASAVLLACTPANSCGLRCAY